MFKTLGTILLILLLLIVQRCLHFLYEKETVAMCTLLSCRCVQYGASVTSKIWGVSVTSKMWGASMTSKIWGSLVTSKIGGASVTSKIIECGCRK